MSGFVYLNGQFVASEQAVVSLFDAGLLHGAGLFETMRAYGGVLFRPMDHLARLAASAEVLSMFELGDPARQVLARDLGELLRRNELTEARVRLTVTAAHGHRVHRREPAFCGVPNEQRRSASPGVCHDQRAS